MSSSLKKLIYILAGLIVLYGIIVYTENAGRQRLNKKVNLQKVLKDVKKIHVQFTAQDYELFLADGKWHVKDNNTKKEDYVDTGKLNRFINNFKELSLIGVATGDPEKYKEYGVDDTSAVKVSFTNKKGKKKTVYVGNSGPDYNSAFIRLGKDRRVFLVRNIAPYRIKRYFKYWRYRKIFDVNHDNFDGLEIQKDKKVVKVYKKGRDWFKQIGRKEEKLDTATLKDIISKVNQIVIDDYGVKYDTQFYELDRSKYRFKVLLKDEEIRLAFGKVTNSKYATLISGREGEIYLINTYRIDNLRRKLMPDK